MGLLALGILLGCVVFVIALFAKKRGCATLLLPCPLLILLWVVLAATPPNAEMECQRLFGEEAVLKVSELKSLKPFGMDGFLLSFKISPQDFNQLIRPASFLAPLGGISFFGGSTRPESWPAILETMDECFHREVGEDKLLIHYDESHETVYASFSYWGW
jgi:hypothetical protein